MRQNKSISLFKLGFALLAITISTAVITGCGTGTDASKAADTAKAVVTDTAAKAMDSTKPGIPTDSTSGTIDTTHGKGTDPTADKKPVKK